MQFIQEYLNILKAIQNTLPIIVNGERAELDAIVVDGISHIPTRNIGKILGANVSFVDGSVIISSKNNAKTQGKDVATILELQDGEIEELGIEQVIKLIEEEIYWLEVNMNADKFMLLEKYRLERSPEAINISEEFIQETEDKIEQLQNLKAELEEQLKASK